MIIRLETPFILILALLRPQNLMQSNSSDHHPENKEISNDKQDRHRTAHNLNSARRERLANRECCGDKGGVREDEGVPGHREDHIASANAREVGECGDEEEPYCEPA